MPILNFEEYSELIYALPERHSSIQHSTLVLIPIGVKLGKLEGQITFAREIVLDVWELVDFDVERIRNYSYEIYRAGEKICWFDPFEHPHIPELALTHPHHKHILPDIKHHRVPAPDISFERPNLPFLIAELERELLT